jgi:ferritin
MGVCGRLRGAVPSVTRPHEPEAIRGDDPGRRLACDQEFDPHIFMVQSPFPAIGSENEAIGGELAIATGPAGRAVAQPMDAALLDGLQQHLTLERGASATYWGMAIWFAERELRGFAHYLKNESSAEQHHAGLFADYLIARGQTVVLAGVPAPRQNWGTAEEIFAAVFRLEADVTASLQQLYGQAERAGDVRTTVFLDPVVQGQIESENQAAHLLGRIRFSQNHPAAMLVIDGELSEDRHEMASMA